VPDHLAVVVHVFFFGKRQARARLWKDVVGHGGLRHCRTRVLREGFWRPSNARNAGKQADSGDRPDAHDFLLGNEKFVRVDYTVTRPQAIHIKSSDVLTPPKAGPSLRSG